MATTRHPIIIITTVVKAITITVAAIVPLEPTTATASTITQILIAVIVIKVVIPLLLEVIGATSLHAAASLHASLALITAESAVLTSQELVEVVRVVWPRHAFRRRRIEKANHLAQTADNVWRLALHLAHSFS